LLGQTLGATLGCEATFAKATRALALADPGEMTRTPSCSDLFSVSHHCFGLFRHGFCIESPHRAAFRRLKCARAQHVSL
jgi:hypothetical protein